MDWLLRKCRTIGQILCSYAAFIILALIFACASFLYVFRAWFRVTKATVWEIFPRRIEPSTSRENTSSNVEAQNPPHTMNWERMHQNLESYAALTALSSTEAFFGSLFAVSNAFSSIGTTAWNTAFQQVENSSPSTSTNENIPDLRGIAVRIREIFAARKMSLSDNLGESMPPKEHPQKMLHIHPSQQSSNRPSSQKRMEDELDIEILPEQSPIIHHDNPQGKSTRERIKKIRSSKLESIEPVKGNPRGSNVINVDSKLRKSGGELHQESPGSSSQLSRSARVNSFPASYKINEGVDPGAQSDWAPWEENSQTQIPTFLDSYCSFIDKRQRSESSQGSKNERIRMQDSPLNCTRSRIDSNQSMLRPEESTEESIPSSSSRFPGADVARKPIKQEFQLHSAEHKCVFSSTHVRSKPSETLPKEPRDNSLKEQVAPSKFVETTTDCSLIKLSPKRSRHENISSGGTTQFSGTNVDQKSLKKSAVESPHETAVLHSPPSVLTKAHVGSSPNYKSLRIFPLKFPRIHIGSSTSKIMSEGSQEEYTSKPFKSFPFIRTVVQCPRKQSTEESQYETAILQHSPEAISKIHVQSSPYKQLPEVSRHESSREPGSPSTLATTLEGRSPIKDPLDGVFIKPSSPFKYPIFPIGPDARTLLYESSQYKDTSWPFKSFRVVRDVVNFKRKQSTEESQNETQILQHSPEAISNIRVQSSPYKQLPEGSRHESSRKLGSPAALTMTHVGLSPNKRSLDEDLRVQCPPSKSPRTCINFSPSKSPPETSREEKISISLSPFRFSGTDVLKYQMEKSPEEFQHKRAILQHSPVAISQSHVPSSPHKQLPEDSSDGSSSKIGSPYAFSKAQISSKPIKQESILYQDSPYVFSKTIRSNPNEISIEGSCYEKPVRLGSLYAISESHIHSTPHEGSAIGSQNESLSIQGSLSKYLVASMDSNPEIQSEGFWYENNNTLDQSSQFSRTDVDQYPIKQFAEESQRGNSLLQGSSVDILTIREDSSSSEESPEIYQRENLTIQIPSSPRGTCIHADSSKKSKEIFISENRDVRSVGLPEVNSGTNIGNQITEKSEDVSRSVSETSPKETIKNLGEVLESTKIRVKEEETTTRGKEGVDTESPSKSPIKINVTVKTERNTEDMLPRFHAATVSSDEIPEECNENSPSSFKIKCTIPSEESMEEYIQKLREEFVHLEEPNPSEMKHSSEDSRGILLSVTSSCEPAISEMSHSSEDSSGILLPGPCIQPSIIHVSSVNSEETLVLEQALVENSTNETKTDESVSNESEERI